MNPRLQAFVSKVTGAYVSFHLEDIQSLWSGYGMIMRYGLKGSAHKTAIVKHVRLADKGSHPGGWDSNVSHLRKIHSYKVETAWYRDWAAHCDEHCRVPLCFGLEENDDEFLMVLEDLDASGFSERVNHVDIPVHVHSCLQWLANFHATFMNKQTDELWEVGSYWNLDTRPDEFAALTDEALRTAAPLIDQRLNTARYQTLVHGDAKLANFCFSRDGQRVAAVDFQYVGGGCGIKDVAYFLSSCLDEQECEHHEQQLLSFYFDALEGALSHRQIDVDFNELECEWRELYDFAWADFYRFLAGWNPGHWKIHGYTENTVSCVYEVLGIKK